MKKITSLIILIATINLLSAEAAPVLSRDSSQVKPPVKAQGSYYDMDMVKIAQEIGFELKDEEGEMLEDLRFLWPYAVENSETIKFAIYKLSAQENKKPDENKVKNILKPITSIAPMAAMGTSSAVLGGSALIGGSFLQEILQGGKTPLDKHIEKVSDADLVILAKSIEELQTKLVVSYYDYVTAKKVIIMTDGMLKNRYKNYVSMQSSSDKNLIIADTFYRDAVMKQTKAREDFLVKRSTLEQIVGNEAIMLMEQQQVKKEKEETQQNSPLPQIDKTPAKESSPKVDDSQNQDQSKSESRKKAKKTRKSKKIEKAEKAAEKILKEQEEINSKSNSHSDNLIPVPLRTAK